MAGHSLALGVLLPWRQVPGRPGDGHTRGAVHLRRKTGNLAVRLGRHITVDQRVPAGPAQLMAVSGILMAVLNSLVQNLALGSVSLALLSSDWLFFQPWRPCDSWSSSATA